MRCSLGPGLGSIQARRPTKTPPGWTRCPDPQFRIHPGLEAYWLNEMFSTPGLRSIQASSLSRHLLTG